MSPPYLRVDLLEIAAKWTLCGMRPAFAAMMSMPHAVATITQAIVEEVTEVRWTSDRRDSTTAVGHSRIETSPSLIAWLRCALSSILSP